MRSIILACPLNLPRGQYRRQRSLYIGGGNDRMKDVEPDSHEAISPRSTKRDDPALAVFSSSARADLW